jgi:hypothetical protein
VCEHDAENVRVQVRQVRIVSSVSPAGRPPHFDAVTPPALQLRPSCEVLAACAREDLGNMRSKEPLQGTVKKADDAASEFV